MKPESNARIAVPKRIRFEVFKRDSFKCQYCGTSAPEVILHVDHITPVAAGGTNELTNLLTACFSCNSGKSDKKLDDKSAVQKARNQMEELQERREQLEMMMAWKEGLRDIAQDAVEKVSVYWVTAAPGFSPTANGKKKIRLWLRRYSLDEVLKAMDIAADQYLVFETPERVSQDSWEEAFSKVPRICQVERDSRDDPDLKELFYIRGIVRNKCDRYFNATDCMVWLRAARSWDIPIRELRSIALETRYYSHFTDLISKAIDERKSPEKG